MSRCGRVGARVGWRWQSTASRRWVRRIPAAEATETAEAEMEAAEAETEAAEAGVVAGGRDSVGRVDARVGWWWQWRQGRAKRAYPRACKKRRVLKRSAPRWK
jgi:hypothetical protein